MRCYICDEVLESHEETYDETVCDVCWFQLEPDDREDMEVVWRE